MMKKILPLLIMITSLCSCNSFKNQISSFDTESYKNDLALFDTNLVSTKPKKFNINAYYFVQDNYYIYTLQVVFNGHDIDNLKLIMLPSGFDLNSQNILPCIGYSEKVNLRKNKDLKKNYYPGFNLSYKTDSKDLDFYLFANDGEENYYHVTEFRKMEK